MIGARTMTVGLASLGIPLFATFSFVPSGAARTQGAFNPKAKTARVAMDFVVMANRILANEGVFDAFGHVSVRNPENLETFFIARAIAPEQVTKGDILEVDLEGNVVTKTTIKPYQERIIHAGVYKVRPDVNSVIHAHPAPIVAFSVSAVPLRPVSNGAAQFHQGVPVYDEYDFTSPGNTGMLVTTKAQGDLLAKCLGDGLAVLMRGHGYTVVGSNVPSAVNNAISLRDNAVITFMALQLGAPKYMSTGEAEDSSRGRDAPERAWNAWVHRVKDVMPDTR